MRKEDLLDLMGRIDEYYIDDAAKHLERSPHRSLRRLARPAGAAAAAGILGFSAFVIYGIVRDGIAQQNPAGYSDTAAQAPGTAAYSSETETAEAPGRDDLEVLPVTTEPETTTAPETTVTTTATVPIPPALEDYYDDNGNIIYPDASFEQEIGNTFSVNALAIPSIYSGVMAVTVHSAQCYSSLDEAELALDDLSDAFINDYGIFGSSYFNHGGDAVYLLSREDFSEGDLFGNSYAAKENYDDFNFVKLRITVQNINAVSVYPRVGTIRTYPNNPVPTDEAVNGAGREYDFNMYDLRLGVLPNPEHESEQHISSQWSDYICYSSLKGQEYAPDALGRDGWVYLEPGDAVTLEVGGFVPKYYAFEQMKKYYAQNLYYPEGTDLRPYYFFGAGISFPHVLLNFTEE